MAGRRRGTDLGLLLLGYQLVQFGVDRIPPVTLGTIVLNVLAYKFLPFNVRGTCISTQNVWYQWDLKRLLIGAVDHGDDIHLYYNMVSLLWKGNSLERRFKSPYFAYILVVFTTLTSITMVGINFLLAEVTNNPSYIHQCAVGFSGVIFALKVLTTHYNPPGTQYVMGFIPVPSKWVFWAELALIQVLVPNASFTGHLAGILVGLAYVRGPLKRIMDMFIPSVPSYSYRSGSSGYRPPSWDNAGQGYSTGYTTRGFSTNQGGFPSNQWGFQSSQGGFPSSQRGFPGYGQQPGAGPQPSASPPPGWRFSHMTGDLSEEEQIQQLMERSRYER